MITICTDSSSLLPLEDAGELGVIVVPIEITLDGVPWDERAGRVDDFYDRVRAGARASTSQPSPGTFLEAYTVASAGGADWLISIHLDGRASGTVRSAELAALDAPLPISIVDTGTASFGVAVCVRAAAKALADGASADDAAAVARTLGRTLGNAFVARTGRGGRVPEEAGWAVLELVDGTAVSRAATTDVGHAIEAMTERAQTAAVPLCAAVGHAASSTEPAADQLAASIAALPRVEAVERYRVGPAVGAHTGPESFGAFWWPSPG